ncbi:MAG TPA: amino acid adenylation domain-containing protein [Thermoanaerobaculia bacterium]|nr:amino acid adenylation domain-containing protein [Thermoanaerobaculia bacterium]
MELERFGARKYPFATAGVTSLVALLGERARQNPERDIYVFLSDDGATAETIRYGELDRRARAIAGELQRLGFAGERALLLYPPGLEFITAFFGCLYAGAIAVPAYPPRSKRPPSRLAAMAGDAQAAVALTTSDLRSRADSWQRQAPALAGLEWIATDGLDTSAASRWCPPELSGETLAFLQYTSGSTSTPRGVMVSHGNLLHNQEQMRRAFGQSEASIVVGWLPLYHDMGLIGNVLQPLYVGGRCILMSPASFLQRPRLWLETISRYRATTSGGPNFAFELCVQKIRPSERAGLDLASWSVAFTGAEPVRPETLERFAGAFAPCGFRRAALYPCYGLAEATLFVSGPRQGAAPRLAAFSAAALAENRAEPIAPELPEARRLTGCGWARGEQRLAIADPATAEECGPGEVGEIWVAGPSVALGYWGRPEEAKGTFGAFLAGGEGPFLRTGDLGFLGDPGPEGERELFVTGRIKDLVILRGRNHYPQDLELTAEGSHPDLRPGCGAAFAVEAEGEERLIVVHEVERHPRDPFVAIAGAVRRAVAEEHEVQVHEVVLLRPGSIPKTSSGKIQRHACRAGYLDGTLAVVAASGPAALEPAGREPGASLPACDREALAALDPAGRCAALLAFLEDRAAAAIGLGRRRPTSDQPLTALGLDSLSALELKAAVEGALAVPLPVADLLAGATTAELAERLLAALATAGPAAPFGPPAAGEGTAEGAILHRGPTSAGQRALWFLESLAPQGGAYNVVAAGRSELPLDAAALRRALVRLTARHPALRTTFASEDGEPVQVIHPVPLDLDFSAEDAAGWSEEKCGARLAAEAFRPFDLAGGPLMRVRLWARGPGHVLLFAIHHVVADFASLAVISRELSALLREETGGPPADLPPLRADLAGFAHRQAASLAGPRGEALWDYWREQLAGPVPDLDLPTDLRRPPISTWRGGACSLVLPRELGDRIRSAGRAEGATLFATLLAAWTLLLGRVAGQEDFAVGAPATDRSEPGLSAAVGYFVNLVVLRADLAGDPSCAELLGRTRRTVTMALEHTGFPLPLLAERLRPVRDPVRSPLFQTMLTFQPRRPGEDPGLLGFSLGEPGARIDLGGIALESLRLAERRAQFDLTLRIAELDQGLTAVLEHNADLFEPATAVRLLGCFRTLIAGMVDAPGHRVWSLPLLGEAERAQVLTEWNATGEPTPAAARHLCLHQLFEAQAACAPGAEALVAPGERLTYGELDARANRLARHLRDLGIGPERRVGVCLERTADLVVALLAVLKAGGAYLPLDLRYPAERLSFLLADAGADVVITRSGSEAWRPGVGAVLLDRDAPRIAARDAGALEPLAGPGNLAYLIYTSGSTGHPKGVAIEHRSAVAMAFWARETFSPAELAGVLAATSVGFDLSVFELFVPLAWGGKVVLAADLLALPRLVAAAEVTLVNTVPSVLSELLHEGALPPSVVTVNLAGESLSGGLVSALHALPGALRVLNLYGPSEDTTYSTWAQMPRGLAAEPSIGRPVAGTRAYVLDGRGEAVPPGVPGELYLGGEGLARGYLGRPDLTAERFVPDSLSGEPGARLYRTGDLVRHRREGSLDFVGRIDHQVKVRGFRIEPGEIEAALRHHPAVREAAVVACEDGRRGRRLVAFVVLTAAVPPAASRALYAELRAFLAVRLPDPWVPADWMVLRELPLTPNGKVDRRALAVRGESAEAIREETAEPGAGAPRTPAEELIAGIWSEVLGVERVGRGDDFFDAGGHSLLASRAASRISRAFGVDVPLALLFQAPTPAALAERLASRPAMGAPLQPVPRGGGLPLSFAQLRLWFLDRLRPGSAAYNMPGAMRLEGPLDLVALGATLGEIMRRHEALRTSFPAGLEGPVQRVAPPLSGPEPLPLADLSGLPEPVRRRELERLVAVEGTRPFDLACGPLYRFTALRSSACEHHLLVTLHHGVADGWSLGVLFHELTALYARHAACLQDALPPLAVHYADWAIWQREQLASGELAPQLAYWRERLAGLPVLELPADRPRLGLRSLRGGIREGVLSAALGDSVDRLARRLGATSFMVLLASFQALLGRYTGEERVAVGSPVANRQRPEVEPLIGLFVNVLVLDASLAGNPSFGSLLVQVRAACLAAYLHQDLPFERLVEELHPEREPAQNPLFQVLFAQEEPFAPRRAGDLLFEPRRTPNGAAKLDLTLTVARRPAGGLAAAVEYAAELFEPVRIERLLAHWESLLAGAVADPEARLSSLALLTAAERAQLLVEWNDVPAVPAPSCLHELFAAQVARSPEAEALVSGEERLTYGALLARSRRLARHLQALGVGPEVRVGVFLRRTLDLVVSMLGVLTAGGAYVPLDPAYPRERLETMLADSGAEILLTERELAGNAGSFGGLTILLDADGPAIAAWPAERPASGAVPENLAYLIYTSGSTGRPKAVAIAHRSAVALVAWAREVFPPADLAGVLASTSVCFDLSVFELLVPLCCGGRVILANDALALPLLPALREVTLLNTVPSAMAELVGNRALPALPRTVALAGEPLKGTLAAQVYARPGVERLFNLYGPSEDTTYSTFSLVPRDEARPPSIGRPLAGSRVHLLDLGGAPVPLGVSGELCLGGAGLARGYLGRPGLTAERFVPDPFSEPGGRLYRTGDLARWRPDGQIELLGRIDHQVKVRGFRVELGEIEALLAAHPAVGAAAVMARDEEGDVRLAAYVAPAEGGAGAGKAMAEALRAHLRERLPEHMVPAVWTVLDRLPLTPSGKVDRRALPRLASPVSWSEAVYEAPRNAVEAAIAGIWREALRAERVGVHDNFFHLGGHSLLAARVAARLQETFGVDIPLRRLFEAVTVARLAELLQETAPVRADRVIPRRPARDRAPASHAQGQLWLLEQLQPGKAAYNNPAAVLLEGALDLPALAGSLAEIVRRHEVLRTTFALAGSELAQIIRSASAVTFVLPVVDLEALPASARRAEEELWIAEEAHRSFDLGRGPLLRVLLLRRRPGEHVVAINLHHIVSDEWSHNVFVRELGQLYEAACAGRSSPLPELPVQYGDFAAWQRHVRQEGALEEHLSWWREQMAGAPAMLSLPTDRPRPSTRSLRGASQPFAWPPELVARLYDLGRARGATLFMTLAAGFMALLHRLSHQDDLVISTGSAHRGRTELEPLIGCFLNVLPLRAGFADAPTFEALLGRVRQGTLGAFAHGDVPFERLVAELRPERDLSYNPLAQVMLTLQSAPAEVPRLGGLALTRLVVERRTAQLDLTLHVWDRPQGLYGFLEHDTDLFAGATAKRLLAHLANLLAAAAAEPGRPVAELPLLDGRERAQVLGEWNATRAVMAGGGLCLHQLIARQAERTPDALAVTAEAGSLTYRELGARSGRLARRLRALGVGPDVLVGVCAERSLELVVGLLAVLEAGGAYVPLDPSYPAARLAFMLADAAVPVLLTQPQLAAGLPPHGARVVLLGGPEPAEDLRGAPAEVLPENLAYAIYTSGSTGRPKGAMNTHAAIVNRLLWMQEAYRLTPADSVLQKTPVSFDVSVWELFWPLLAGARLVMASPGGHQDSAYLVRLIAGEGITTVHFVPSMLRSFLAEKEVSRCVSLRRVIASGEALPPEVERRFGECLAPCGARLFNLYGPTEAAVDVTAWACQGDGSRAGVPIGRPIANLRLHLLDRGAGPVPIGVAGEVHIGGAGLARGYLGRPELTAERFVPDPFAGIDGSEPGARLYKTGDLGRYLPGGEIEFLGRLDHQVKVRGFRIELGEIETVLCRHPEVADAVVVARPSGADVDLVAYVSPAGEAVPAPGELRAFLRDRLPEHMVPALFVELPALPLSPNGKVDRKALPEPGGAARETALFVAPRNAVEERLAGLWGEILGVDRVGVHDNFFALGGHSLVATQLLSRLQDGFHLSLPLRAIFAVPTVAELSATLIEQLLAQGGDEMTTLLDELEGQV